MQKYEIGSKVSLIIINIREQHWVVFISNTASKLIAKPRTCWALPSQEQGESMKTLSLTIVSLFAVAAFANEPAKTAPVAAPAAKTAEAKPADKCAKMTGEAKTKCEAEAKTEKK